MPFRWTQDFVTIKYRPDGSEAWVARAIGGEDRAEVEESPAALVVDPEGNIIVTGTRGFPFTSGIETLKYGQDGQLLWKARYLQSAAETAWPQGIVVQDDGGVTVGGTVATRAATEAAMAATDFLAVKYSRDGDLLCEARSDGPNGGDDLAQGVMSGGAGEVYIVGVSFNGHEDESAHRITVVRHDGLPSDLCAGCSAEGVGTCPELGLSVADPFTGKVRLDVAPLEPIGEVAYTFQVEHYSLEAPLRVGPQEESFVDLELGRELSGDWSFTVRVDRVPYCPHNGVEGVCVSSAQIPHIDFGPFVVAVHTSSPMITT